MDRLCSGSLFGERDRAFCMSVKVSLEKLCSETANRSKHISELGEHFNSGQFDWLDIDSHILAVVTPDILPQSLFDRTKYVLQSPLVFEPLEPLLCLRGREQLEAAQMHYSSSDRWWVVDLYQDG